jgi:hypothetical protein
LLRGNQSCRSKRSKRPPVKGIKEYQRDALLPNCGGGEVLGDTVEAGKSVAGILKVQGSVSVRICCYRRNDQGTCALIIQWKCIGEAGGKETEEDESSSCSWQQHRWRVFCTSYLPGTHLLFAKLSVPSGIVHGFIVVDGTNQCHLQ